MRMGRNKGWDRRQKQILALVPWQQPHHWLLKGSEKKDNKTSSPGDATSPPPPPPQHTAGCIRKTEQEPSIHTLLIIIHFTLISALSIALSLSLWSIIYIINKFLLFISLLQITLKELMTRSRNEQEKYLWSLNLPRYRAYFLLPPRSDWSSPLATACACSANGAGRVRHSWPITASSGRMRQKTVTR